jgi:adenylate cyclase
MYGTNIIVSESTKLQAGNDLAFREIDLVAVKGKQLPVPIYELMIADDCEGRAQFNEALKFYRDRKFDNALQIFSSLSEQKRDPVSSLYVGRCYEFIAEPPEEIWDGVFIAKSK